VHELLDSVLGCGSSEVARPFDVQTADDRVRETRIRERRRQMDDRRDAVQSARQGTRLEQVGLS
jgi:hypothetical protein